MNGNGKPRSAGEAAGALVGCLKGHGDLSTSDEHIEDLGADSLPEFGPDSSTCGG